MNWILKINKSDYITLLLKTPHCLPTVPRRHCVLLGTACQALHAQWPWPGFPPAPPASPICVSWCVFCSLCAWSALCLFLCGSLCMCVFSVGKELPQDLCGPPFLSFGCQRRCHLLRGALCGHPLSLCHPLSGLLVCSHSPSSAPGILLAWWYTSSHPLLCVSFMRGSFTPRIIWLLALRTRLWPTQKGHC